MSLTRRMALSGASAFAASALAAPRLSRAQGASVLRFVPQSDLAVLDPILTAA